MGALHSGKGLKNKCAKMERQLRERIRGKWQHQQYRILKGQLGIIIFGRVVEETAWTEEGYMNSTVVTVVKVV